MYISSGVYFLLKNTDTAFGPLKYCATRRSSRIALVHAPFFLLFLYVFLSLELRYVPVDLTQYAIALSIRHVLSQVIERPFQMQFRMQNYVPS